MVINKSYPLVAVALRCRDQHRKVEMTKQEIRDAIEFLQRLFVGPGDVDRLEAAITALKQELQRRNKKRPTTPTRYAR